MRQVSVHALSLAASLVFACVAAGGDATPPRVPAGALAWWRYDPTAFPAPPDAAPGAERGLLLASLRAALASGSLGNRTGAMLGALLLVGLEAGDRPHTLALLELSASRPPSGTGVDLHELRIALRVDSAERHTDMLRTVRAVAIDAFVPPVEEGGAAPDPGMQARFPLPQGRTGVAFRRADWEPWREISWCSEADAFTIGVGRGTLPAWFQPPPPDAAPTPWEDFRHALDATRPTAPIVFECFIDIDALRAHFPDAFLTGRTPRMLAALDLSGAAAILFQARAVPATLPDGRSLPLMAIDVAVLNQSGELEVRSLSHHQWPADVSPAVVPPGTTSATVATVDWQAAFARVLAMHAATIPNRKLPRFQARADAWLAEHGRELDAALAEFAPALVIWTHPRIPAPVPGVGCISIRARDEVPAGRVSARLLRVLAPFEPGVRADLPTKKATTPVWSLRVDRTGMVRLPWWTLVPTGSGPPVLVGSWSAASLETVRRWLGGEVPP